MKDEVQNPSVAAPLPLALSSEFKRYLLPLVLIISIAAPIWGSHLLVTMFPHWLYKNEPLHSCIEAAGGVTAVILAVFLVISQAYRLNAKTSFTSVACSFILMGVLDTFHALQPPNFSFFWTHGLSTLFGGVAAAFVWSERTNSLKKRALLVPSIMMAIAFIIALMLTAFPTWLPRPFDALGEFSPLASAVNFIGGMGFFAAAVYFLIQYWGDQTEESLTFMFQFILFGLAGTLFSNSSLWDAPWWFWHLLRLIAYLIVVRNIFSSFNLSQKQLRGAYLGLEQRVKVRTAELESAQAQSLEMIDALESERQLRDKFISALTHDLRTPLTVARMSSQRLLKKSEDPGIYKLANRIISNMDRADNMIRDLLDATRIKAGHKIPVQPVSFDFSALCRAVVEEMKLMYEDRFVLKMPASAKYNGDDTAVRRILENLLNNAVKYGTMHTPITVTLIQRQDDLALSVHNLGAVISPDDQNRLFNEFHRTALAETSKQLGWGVGLTIVKALVDAHAGKITVKSTNEEGTTFTVSLPTKGDL